MASKKTLGKKVSDILTPPKKKDTYKPPKMEQPSHPHLKGVTVSKNLLKQAIAKSKKVRSIPKHQRKKTPLPDDPNIGNVPEQRGKLRDWVEKQTGESLETTLRRAGLDNDVLENIIRPHKSTMTAAKNRARIEALQKAGKKYGGKVVKRKKGKSVGGSKIKIKKIKKPVGMSATFPKYVGVTAKKHGGKITYKMSGGQVVDAGYD